MHIDGLSVQMWARCSFCGAVFRRDELQLQLQLLFNVSQAAASVPLPSIKYV